jgi:drug/metabolite transporter (DMT)-like permease
VFLLVVAMVTYGFSWVSGKRISTVLSPATLACIRFFITFLCFLPFAAVRRIPENRRRVSPGGWLKTAAAAVMIAAYNILFFIGLRSGLAGKGGLIVTTMNPLVTALILLLMRRDRPGTLAVLGLSAGIAGGILLFEPWHFPMSVILKSGNLAFLGAAAAWSLLTIISRSAQKTMGFRNFNSGLYALATLLMLPFAAAEIRSGFPQGLTPAFWGDMLFISIGVGAFGTGVYFAASSRLGAAKTSSFTYLVPVSALIFTYLFLGERPDPSMIAGGVLAVAAVILVNRPAGRERLPD